MRSTLLSFLILTFACGTPTPITALVVGDDLSCAIGGNQTLCWGNGDPIANRQIFGSPVTKLLMGSMTYCALLEGSGWSCWGSNAQGQFGISTPAMTTIPVPISFLGDTLKLARFGGEFSCGTTEGTLACWGAADRGQLGPTRSTNTFLATSIVVPGMVREFALGRDHACAISDMGVWCWGAGTEGQLGNLDSQDSATPVQVPVDAAFVAELSNMDASVSVALGERHSCAQAGAEVRCWGADELGQLGQSARNSASGVYIVPGGALSGTLQAGANHTCTVSAEGVAQCWGSNEKGQLQSASPNPMGPLTIGVMPIESIGLGNEHSCVFSAGQVLCWGSATQGQLGPSTSLDTFVPTSVPGLQ